MNTLLSVRCNNCSNECVLFCLCLFQQVKSDCDQSGLALCNRPIAAVSPALLFPTASPTPELDVASQQAEGDAGRDLLLANAVIKSETQEPLNDKPSCASAPAAEVARVQDYPSPQPIPPGECDSVPLYK